MQLTIILVKSFITFIEMKNEDRIVELLAESLKRQNRQAEILQQHTNILTEHTGILNQVSTMLGRLVERMENFTDSINSKFNQVQDHETRITRLENKFLK